MIKEVKVDEKENGRRREKKLEITLLCCRLTIPKDDDDDNEDKNDTHIHLHTFCVNKPAGLL